MERCMKRREYEIKFPSQLVVGDIIINPKGARSFFKVSFVDQGFGAGHFDFGQYVVITGNYVFDKEYKDRDSFWSFEHEPLIVLKGQ